MHARTHRPNNGHGWKLDLKQCIDLDHFDPALRPLVIVPGYGMNSFIFGFHPSGPPMEAYLAAQGFEVWSVNLRGQGGSKSIGGSRKYGFRELALVDLPCIIDTVLAETRTEHTQVDVIGCSLGATITYSYLAHHANDHRIGSMANIGGPLRWNQVHPLIRTAFVYPKLASIVPVRGTKKLARAALPIARKVPRALSIYMNAKISDLSQADALVQTVDNPNSYLNYQIACWVKNKDLVVNGLNISHALKRMEQIPMLCLAGNKDGIVPPETALSAVSVLGEDRVEKLIVGDHTHQFSHADLFISRLSQDRVFRPVADWFKQNY